jgi:hypothetical protein
MVGDNKSQRSTGETKTSSTEPFHANPELTTASAWVQGQYKNE